jgi:glucosamine--fructose-6-phosphate aminotransferase (isomerizing)
MCGIVGYVGHQNAVPILVEGLHRLEYRGYDSAGLAVQRKHGIEVHKRQGKVREMEASLPKRFAGVVGVGHTRWATHGAPSDDNAHPQIDASGRIAVVHNGIVENAHELRAQLEARGVVFASQTDTEVLAQLIASVEADSLEDAVRTALRAITGTYGIAVMDARHPDQIVVARNGSPVILGIGDKEMFIASDASALVRHTQQAIYLDDGEIAVVEARGFRVTSLDALPSTKQTTTLEIVDEQMSKGSFSHFTMKEIHEQPDAVRGTLRGRLDRRFSTARLDGLNLPARDLLRFRRIKIIGCGSACISGFLGARMIERLSRIPCDAESAAEFRYRNPVIEDDTLYVAVSQSGETFDTLAAVEEIKRKGGAVVGIVNVVGSTIARACGRGVYLHAGPEIAVVSTKTFMSTLVAFVLLALHLGRMKDVSAGAGRRIIDALDRLPDALASLIADQAQMTELAKKYARFANAYFVGRNEGYALAMEGALKLKEVSYLHAEAYPASELKHGPLALISPDTLTVVVIPSDDLFEKNVSTIEEIRARRGPVIALAHTAKLPVDVDDVIVVPQLHELLDPLLMLVPLQQFAFQVAIERGCDIDQPRNLAKSVTVE